MGARPRTLKLSCTAPACLRPSVTRGYCRKHYQQIYKDGKLTPKADHEKRFWAKVNRGAPEMCWPWTASVFKTTGYGQFRTAQGPVGTAHRIAYEYAIGPIPPGLWLDHMCHTSDCTLGTDCPHRRCCNPSHLRPSTPLENSAPDRAYRDRSYRKTHCPQGHEYTPENTRFDKRGSRHCRTCRYRTSS